MVVEIVVEIVGPWSVSTVPDEMITEGNVLTFRVFFWEFRPRNNLHLRAYSIEISQIRFGIFSFVTSSDKMHKHQRIPQNQTVFWKGLDHFDPILDPHGFLGKSDFWSASILGIYGKPFLWTFGISRTIIPLKIPSPCISLGVVPYPALVVS